MRPIKLTIQAFGPFAQTEYLDFTELGDNPLFLINGATGSGKTSILDAICYALYGETTSNERQGVQMRCDQASIDLLTEVTFEFDLNGISYRVTRTPEQDVPKSRGEGFTVKKHSATLVRLDDDETLITSKTAQVKTEVSTLIGLNETQFRQVMVLPQGKFRELLLASSKEREVIFGQLFQTDMYKKIEFALKDKASAISKAKNDFDNQICGALQVAEVSNESELEQSLKDAEGHFQQLKKSEQQATAKLTQTKQEQHSAIELTKQFDQLEQSERALTHHQNEKAGIDSLKSQIELTQAAVAISSFFTQWKNDSQQVDKLTLALKALEQQLDAGKCTLTKQLEIQSAAHKAVQQVPELTQQLFTLEQSKKSWLEKQQVAKSIAEKNKLKLQLNEKLSQYQALKQTLENDALQGEQALQQARTELEQKTPLELQKATLERLIADLFKRDAQQREIERAQSTIQQLQQSSVACERAYQQVSLAADQVELNWHNSQAAVLAERLQTGQPCPVCGSNTHPSLARYADEAVTKQDVEHARREEKTAQTAYTNSKGLLEQHLAAIEQLNKQLDQITESLGECQGDTPLAKQTELTDVITRLEVLNQIDIHKMELSVRELKQRCANGEDKIAQVKQQMIANDSSVDMLEQQLDKLSESLANDVNSLEEINQQLILGQQYIDALNRAYEDGQKHYQQAQLALNSLESEHKTKHAMLVTEESKLVHSSTQWLEAFESSRFESEDQYQAALSDNSQLDSMHGKVNEYQNRELQLTQTVEDLTKQLKNVVRPNPSEIEARVSAQQSAYNEVREAFDLAYSAYQRIEKVKQDITALHTKNSKLEQEYKVYGTLYDVASGKTGSRISLHRFVLGVLLDDVLIQASQRLNLMSKGRYLLTRKTEGFKGSAGRGLDLCVEDGYTGKSRDVATLSGGESFMAALALALGLSDVVQSYSGGIRLDTLFIDEGFGSLDPESLDLALQMLIDLQQSGRTIGLISHVSELKEQMPLRIDVQGSRTGSSIRMIGR